MRSNMLGIQMEESGGFINLGELSKPATVLIEKISDAIGGVFRPYQIRRIAEANAKADRIQALSQIEITELQQRAVQRFVAEEAKKQINIESITQKALPGVDAEADPSKVDDDWITHFFDSCRLISDEEMQRLWAALLAGEANGPGTHSKRTVTVLSSLDKKDAILFQQLCSFGWIIGHVTALIYEVNDSIYTDNGINFSSLKHLDNLGLVSFESLTGYQRRELPKKVILYYYGKLVSVEFKEDVNNSIDIGHVLLSQAGLQLAPICATQPVEGFMEYVIDRWKGKGYVVEQIDTEQ